MKRRDFLRNMTLGTLACSLPFSEQRVRAEGNRSLLVPAGRNMRIANVGVGGKGYSDMMSVKSEDIVAICDVDFAMAQRAFQEFPLAARYRDFRQMLHEMGDQIDAVMVATPDHMHFPIALMAMEMGKHVYVQKPMAHTVSEALKLKEVAQRTGVITQMGNQGHTNEGTRLLKEWVEAGVIGPVREVHCWTNRPVWPQGRDWPAEVAPPATLDWNLWQGVAPERGYSPELLPFKWRAWWNYGCGALGDMGCHVMDAPFWALNLRGPFRVRAESNGGSEIVAPLGAVVTYEFPARGALPPVKMVWYEGNQKPSKAPELGPDDKMPSGGILLRGDKGAIMNAGDYCDSPRLIPESRMQDFTNRPPKTIPRVRKGPYVEWIQACKGTGPLPGSNFIDHAADLTAMVLMGNVAIRSGQVLDWDPVKGLGPESGDAARYLSNAYRIF